MAAARQQDRARREDDGESRGDHDPCAAGALRGDRGLIDVLVFGR
jgi:hypothetical protein